VIVSRLQDHCYGLFGLLMMLTMKGGKRPTDAAGNQIPFEVVGPQGTKAQNSR
jgi:hypothetical protein